jgi:hypothetical protein
MAEARTTANGTGHAAHAVYAVNRTNGQRIVGRFIIGNPEPKLLEIVGALDSPGCLARGLHRGQKQGDQDRDNRDHDEKLNQCKTTTSL